MAQEPVIDLLKKAYSAEVEAVMDYQTKAIVLDDERADEINDCLQQCVQQELEHAERVGKRLKQLDACLPGSAEFSINQDSVQLPEDPTDVLSVIRGVIDAENDAIEAYRSLADAAQGANDPVTRDLAAAILAEEEAHRDEFRDFEMEYR